MDKDQVCRGCNIVLICLAPFKGCPCRKCLVKATCAELCYERHLTGANNLNLKPLTEEEFKSLGRRWLQSV